VFWETWFPVDFISNEDEFIYNVIVYLSTGKVMIQGRE
jgi:hypothetical protein